MPDFLVGHGEAGSESHMAVDCEIDVVLTPTLAGFGHAFYTLLIGLDAAHRMGARLLLPDNYWDGSIDHSDYSDWAWQLVPVPRASSHPLPSHMLRVSEQMSRSQFLQSWQCGRRYEAVNMQDCHRERDVWQTSSSASELSPWCFCALPGAAHRGASHLGALQLAHATSSTTLPRRVPGVAWTGDELQRLLPLVRHRAGGRHAPTSSGPITVLWHLRTGDIRTYLKEGTLESLKAILDGGFPKRGVMHWALSEKAPKQLLAVFPWLQRHNVSILPWYNYTAEDAVVHAIEQMVGAHVLVSSGSSFSMAAAALAPLGRQIHLLLPPKEAFISLRAARIEALSRNVHATPAHYAEGNESSPSLGVDISQAKGTISGMSDEGEDVKVTALATMGADALRSNLCWRTFFSGHNTVPVDFGGRIFPGGYLQKLQLAMTAVDGRGIVPPSLANMQFEAFL